MNASLTFNRSRLIGVDILRAVFIVLAILIHMAWRSSWWVPPLLHHWTQATVTVGEFFVFTAGLMAYYQYAQKFIHSRSATSLKIWRKAIAILTYFAVSYGVLILTSWPATSFVQVAVQATNNILFLFTLIYLLSPALLFVLTSRVLSTVGSLIMFVVSVYFVLNEWVIGTVHPNIFIIRYSVGGFSLVPLLGLYFAGFWTAGLWFERTVDRKWLGFLGWIILGLTCSWWLMRGPEIVVLKRYLWLYALLPGSFWAMQGFEPVVRRLFENRKVIRFVAMLGNQSLVFFTTGNILIYLTPKVINWDGWLPHWIGAILGLSALGAFSYQRYVLSKNRLSRQLPKNRLLPLHKGLLAQRMGRLTFLTSPSNSCHLATQKSR